MFKWLADKWKKFDIVKVVDGQTVLYLRRYFIWRCSWFNIFLHYIPMPDTDRDPHDHPWSFLSVRLRGGYLEDVYQNRNVRTTHYNDAPSVGWRKAETVHKITHVKPGTWTLIITGPARREWGFLRLDEEGKDKWVFWREYLNCWDKVEMD